MHSKLVLRIALAGIVLLSTACGGGAGSSTPRVALPAATFPPVAVPAATSGDDWTTFAHDQQRTGFEQQNTGITAANAAQLHVKWTYTIPEGEHASPLVSGGSVYLLSDTSILRSLSAASGALQWQKQLAYSARMTPALADGMLFVGAYNAAPNFFAVDAATGTVRWQASLPGWVRAEPVIANGIVYEGSSGGDLPFCYQGGVFAFNERTGSQLWKWLVDPVPNDGGSVWGPISYDGQNVVFGTGNTCNTIEDFGDSVVSLTPAGMLRWEWDQPKGDSRVDNDTGSGPTIVSDHVYVMNKNASIYNLDEATGITLWAKSMGSFEGYGSIGTATTDGQILIASVGSYQDPTVVQNEGGAILGMRADGSVAWTIKTQHAVPGYVAVGHGIAFAALDNTITALNPETGTVLWKYTAPAQFYASPVLVPSGVYAVDTAGHVYAFALK